MDRRSRDSSDEYRAGLGSRCLADPALDGPHRVTMLSDGGRGPKVRSVIVLAISALALLATPRPSRRSPAVSSARSWSAEANRRASWEGVSRCRDLLDRDHLGHLRSRPDSEPPANRQPAQRRSTARSSDPIGHAGRRGDVSRYPVECPRARPRPQQIRLRQRRRRGRPSGAAWPLVRGRRADARPSCPSPGRGQPLIAALNRHPVGC